MDTQVLRQPGPNHHSSAIVHGSGRPQLAHPGIDEGDAGVTCLPRGQLTDVLSLHVHLDVGKGARSR